MIIISAIILLTVIVHFSHILRATEFHNRLRDIKFSKILKCQEYRNQLCIYVIFWKSSVRLCDKNMKYYKVTYVIMLYQILRNVGNAGNIVFICFSFISFFVSAKCLDTRDVHTWNIIVRKFYVNFFFFNLL